MYHMYLRAVCGLSLQAASKTFYAETNVHMKRVLLYNPHSSNDVLHVPQILPPLARFLPEIVELSREHGLTISADGGLALQPIEILAAEVALETASLCALPLSAFTTSTRPVRLNVQLAAAPRRTRQLWRVLSRTLGLIHNRVSRCAC
eukprot:6141327-Pleurochrysis_carterae.AAC.3